MSDFDDPKEEKGRREMERAELSHSEKVRAVFEKFDKDGDGRLNFDEACAYSFAKEGQLLDKATWAEVCGALGFSAAQGMGYEHFERMYDAYWVDRGGNDINVDYMNLCEDTKAEPKTTVTQNPGREEGVPSDSSERVETLKWHQMQSRKSELKIRPRAGGGRRKKSKRRKTSKRRKSKTRRRRR